MSSFAEVLEDLEAFGIESCHVRNKDIIGFSAQNWDDDDSLEPRPTTLFFYFPNKKKGEQWAVREWHETTGIHGCVCRKPLDRWVFIADPGEVYVLGDGDDDDEKSITSRKPSFFTSLRCIAGGFAYAVGVGREIYRRTAPNKWQRLTTDDLTKPLNGNLENAGFDDIDGFAEDDIYACGPRGNLWHFDGKRWTREEIPTDAALEKIVCASDGLVYLTTDRHDLWVGRKGKWKSIRINLGSDEFFQEIVSYQELVIVSTDEALYDVSTGEARPLPIGQPPMSNFAHLASGDGILVVAGVDEAFLHDGLRWKKIFQL
jgi:hypothetical protein